MIMKVVHYELISDDLDGIKNSLIRVCDQNISLVLNDRWNRTV